MKKSFSILALASIALLASAAVAQTGASASIRGISSGRDSAVIHTSQAIYRTDDNGASWREIRVPVGVFSAGIPSEIAAVLFENSQNGWVVMAEQNRVALAVTKDGGESFATKLIALDSFSDVEAVAGTATISRRGKLLEIEFRTQTSSNFEGRVVYSSADNGNSWSLSRRSVEPASADEKPLASGEWSVRTEGRCESFKTACYQETSVLRSGTDKTPPQIAAMNEAAKAGAKAEAAQNAIFALPPGGNTRISLNRGFDKCQAGTVSQMQTWWNNSPHFDSNIYFSGRNRACPSQPFSVPGSTWINDVTAQGWGLIPTVVGYQSPCTSSTTTVKLSYDPAVSETQGRTEADIAAADAASIGLTAGSILYYDMERYDPPSPDTLGCRVATVAFLKGWTERIKQLGYQSGVYGSPKNAQEDWQFMPTESRMDAIWMARWDNVMSVWTYVTFPTFPTNVWNNHQRIKQWQAPHNETWGGVTFNIDGNISDAPVAGNPVRKNKNADFDGDGKTDISVFRPEGGLWYVLNSQTSALTVTAFGSPTDVIAPADYDGDGKTDFAIFRPSSGVWFTMGKAGVVAGRQFGTDGDIPVSADYNGDGKADIAVFRPTTGVWYIANSDSQGTYTFIQFGSPGDKPVHADYDGDGKTDIAIWRPSTGDWYILNSTTGSFTAYRFGISTDRPAQGDFDGDGKADYTIYRDGVWYVLQSTAGLAVYQFGSAGDIPVTGDYDGDNKADFAVYRPSSGVWFLQQSTTGFGGAVFGTGADRPVPSGYLAQ